MPVVNGDGARVTAPPTNVVDSNGVEDAVQTMNRNGRLLLIADDATADVVRRALPDCRLTRRGTALEGLWTAALDSFDGVLVAQPVGARSVKLVRYLRRVAAGARIIAALRASDEPMAAQVLDAGAHDYVLDPLSRADLEHAFNMPSLPPPAERAAAAPALDEIAQLSVLLQRLADGPIATLERLAHLLKTVFDAAGAAIEIDAQTIVSGDLPSVVLEAPIRRGEAVVGRAMLAARRGGPYSPGDAHRLADLGRLIDAVMAQIRERGRLEDLAWRDDATGLANGRCFEQRLDAALTRAREIRSELSVVLLEDAERRHGAASKASLGRLAAALERGTRETDLAVRFDDGRFALLLVAGERPRALGSRHPSDAGALLERFAALSPAVADEAAAPRLAGAIATYPWDGQTAEALLSAAEAKLSATRGDAAK